jgi:hypothetical protein
MVAGMQDLENSKVSQHLAYAERDGRHEEQKERDINEILKRLSIYA